MQVGESPGIFMVWPVRNLWHRKHERSFTIKDISCVNLRCFFCSFGLSACDVNLLSVILDFQ